MHIRVAQIQHYSQIQHHSDIGIQLNRQTFESDWIVVAENNSQADDARCLLSVGADVSISGVVTQRIEGRAQVIGTQHSKCFFGYQSHQF